MSHHVRPTLDKLVDLDLLAGELEGGWVKRNPHPTLPISIYTYTRQCQYDQRWNEVTIACRGLVVDNDTLEVVGFCFPKFFNYEQQGKYDFAPPLPVGQAFEIFAKMDGSLGIIFNYKGQWIAASKGSFISDQAQFAQRWLDSRDTSHLEPGFTYLTEIIYPENRIVVDYGSREDLVLLSVFDSDGAEHGLKYCCTDAWKAVGGSVVQSLGIYDHAQTIASMANGDVGYSGQKVRGYEQEGYVLRFHGGVRTKIKFAEYVHLHRLMTGVNANDIWRTLAVALNPEESAKRLAFALLCSEDEINSIRSSGGSDPIEAMLRCVPDEFDRWVRATCDSILDRIRDLRGEFLSAHCEAVAAVGKDDRRAYAKYALKFPVRIRSGMFLLLDDKNPAMLLWRDAKPETATPFREDEEG